MNRHIYLIARFLSTTVVVIVLIFAIYKVMALTNTWDFSNAADYVYNTLYVDVTGGQASLKTLDQTDNDNTSEGFGGGTHSNTQFDTDHIEMDSTGLTAGTGTFSSRIFDAGTSTSWSAFTVVPGAPYGKPLPNNKAVETAYSEQNADMSNNLLLFHFDDAGTTSTDSSGNGNDGAYDGTLTGQTGKFGTAFGLNGSDDRIVVADLDELAGAQTMTLEGWFKFDSVNASDVLMAQWNNAVNARFSWQTHTTADELIMYIALTSTNMTNLGQWRTTDADLVAGTWYHLALVWDGTQSANSSKVKMYKNGQALTMSFSGTTGLTSLTSVSGLDFRVGDMENFDPRELPATVDEVAVYTATTSASTLLDRFRRGALDVEYKVRTCDDSACSGESFVGPAASTTDPYSEEDNETTSTPAFTLTGLTDNRYFQYQTLFYTSSSSYTAEVDSVAIGPSHYYSGATTTLSTSTATGYGGQLTAFSATEGGTGSIFYQITSQGDSSNPTWYYWDGSQWSAASADNHYNSSSTVNSNISNFALRGTFSWRAFFISPGATGTATLSSVVATHTAPVLESSQDPNVYVTSDLIIDTDYFTTSSIKSIPDWKISSSSVAVLNMPFEAHGATSTTALDYSDSGNNGTVTNGATFATNTGRDGFGAYTFNDDDSEYITINDHASLRLTDDFTVTAWVKRLSNNFWDGFVSKAAFNGSAASTTGWSISHDPTIGRYRVSVACNGSIDYVDADSGTTSATDFDWHHVAMKVVSGTVYFYIDGVQQGDSSKQSICDSGEQLTIGRFYSDLSSHYLDGIVDEVAIWNRVLSSEQISALKNLQSDRIVAGETAVGESYSVEVTQNDSTKNFATETSNTLIITARTSTTPVISSYSPNYTYYWMRSTQTLPMSVSCGDEDGDTVSVSWEVDGVTAGSGSSFSLVGTTYGASERTVVATCTDDDDNSDTQTFAIHILTSDAFTILTPSNVQQHTEFYPYVGDAQIDWMVDLKDNLNAKFVSFAGDLVNDGGNTTLWSRLQTNVTQLDDQIPYAFAIGNHDYDDNLVEDNSGNRDTTNHETYFPLANYSSESWWGGQQSNTNVNTYQYISANGVDYMLMHLEFCPSDETIDWASGVISANSDKRVMITTHVFLDADDTRNEAGEYLACDDFFDSSYVDDVGKNDGQDLWEELIRNHENIFYVMSAHVLGDGHAMRQDLGVNNNLITQNFHNSYSTFTGHLGTNAFITITIVEPSNNRIHVRTYDPYFDEIHTTLGDLYATLGASSTPATLAASASSQNKIATSWSVNGNPSSNRYLIENTTKGTDSGWFSGTSFTDSSLACGTSYSYRVKTRNAFLYESSYTSTISATTIKCTSGGPIDFGKTDPAPHIKKIFIVNNDESKTDNRNVSITVLRETIESIAISEDPAFTDATFIPYKGGAISYEMTSGNGVKTLYMKMRLENGAVLEGKDVIELVGESHDELGPKNCILLPGAYKHLLSPAVWYVTQDCTKQPFRSPEIFFTYFTSWATVKTTDEFMLATIPDDTLGFMPRGPLWKTTYALAKHPYDPKVYVISNDTKYWIERPEILEALYGRDGWQWIEDVHPDFLASYKMGSTINYTDHHPNHTIVKYKNDSDIYRIEEDPAQTGTQVKRHIKDEKVFKELGLRWDRIVTIGDEEVYQNGTVIE